MTSKGESSGNGGVLDQLYEPGPRELVVVASSDCEMRSHGTSVSSLNGADVSDLASIIKKSGVTLNPLFGESEERIQQEVTSLMDEASAAGEEAGDVPDLSVFYSVDAPDDKLEKLAEQLCGCSGVDAAYVKPAAIPSHVSTEMSEEVLETINMMSSLEGEAPPSTANFRSRQGYLDAAPSGIDASYAHTLSGGRGRGVGVIDIEGAWRFTHEDLTQNQGGVVGGTQSLSQGWRNHGTAVIGVISGDRNAFGIDGICPDARMRAISIFGGMGSAGAIRKAAQLSRKGDIILIELHRPGPRHNYQGRGDQKGYIAIEWWPDDFAAIRYAVTRGVIVVSAAGNGAENLNSTLYNTRPGGFPASWRNPFRRGAGGDSGSVIVGAGAPPPGTHGRNHGPDRSRLGFSNYGSVVDAQGWGREVTTTGYGDLQGGGNEDLWYTDRFSGTSSASPIVVGALGCLQGILRARRRPLMSPARARSLLRYTGSAQTSGPGRPLSQRIGRRPNLRQLVSSALRQDKWNGVQFNGLLSANSTKRWFTHSWPEHWHVLWNVVPVTPRASGGPQLKFDVQVQRSSDRHITYYIAVTNMSNKDIQVEARYTVTGW